MQYVPKRPKNLQYNSVRYHFEGKGIESVLKRTSKAIHDISYLGIRNTAIATYYKQNDLYRMGEK